MVHEAIAMTVRLNCLCGHGPDIGWMKMVKRTAESAEPANTVQILQFECPACHHRVAAEVVITQSKPE